MTTLVARKNNSFVNPSWTILVDGREEYFLSRRHNRYWFFEAVVDNKGQVRSDQEEIEAEVVLRVTDDLTFASVLGVIRTTVDDYAKRLSDEAQWDMENDLIVERFYESRMTDADKAQEDWEYANLS